MSMNDKAFNQKRKTAKGNLTRFRSAFQELAIDSLMHVMEHGSTGRATAIVGDLEGSKEQGTLIMFLEDFGGLRYVKASKKKAARFKVAEAMDKDTLKEQIGVAGDNNWWEYKRGGKAEEAFDPLKNFTDTMSYLQRQHDKAANAGYEKLAKAYADMMQRFGLSAEQKGKELKERAQNVIPVDFKKPAAKEENKGQTAEAASA